MVVQNTVFASLSVYSLNSQLVGHGGKIQYSKLWSTGAKLKAQGPIPACHIILLWSTKANYL